MSESLQDQLMALGLAKDRPKKKSRPKRRPKKQRAAGSGQDISLDAAYRAREQSEKASQERAKAEKRALDMERRRINKKIEALLDGQAQNVDGADLKRNFLFKGRIRTVRVTPEQLAAVNDGSLGVVFLRGNYLLVDPQLRDQIAALSADHVPDLSGDGSAEEEGDHPVPDDLVW